jgi:hypothetical protein
VDQLIQWNVLIFIVLLCNSSTEDQIKRLKRQWQLNQEQLEAILVFLRKPDTQGGGLLRPPLDQRVCTCH